MQPTVVIIQFSFLKFSPEIKQLKTKTLNFHNNFIYFKDFHQDKNFTRIKKL